MMSRLLGVCALVLLRSFSGRNAGAAALGELTVAAVLALGPFRKEGP
jgi:hypothetical protein